MKKMLVTDFFREIKKNFGRFISIFFIVLIGTAFFAGLRSSGNAMRASADKYYKDTALMDIKAYSSLGLTGDDIASIAAIKNVDSITPNKTYDAVASFSDGDYSFRIISDTKKINKPYILTGKLPVNNNECLLDSDFANVRNINIGDKIIFKEENNENFSDNISESEFTVTGTGSLPYFSDNGRGNTLIGDGSLDAFIVVNDDIFKSDTYSECYIRVADTDGLSRFSDKYNSLVNDTADDIKKISDDLNSRRKSELVNNLIAMGIPAEMAENEIPDPTFYIDKCEEISCVKTYGDNAGRIDNLGNVLPVIFFLVAALVSLSAMTRLVDEGRTEMGTLKALGYKNSAIAMKYICYAMLATVTGSIIGIIIGEEFLPLLVVTSYQIVYTGLFTVATPFDMAEAVLALIAAAASTGIATVAASARALRSSPAALMRPIPPKSGKRVFMERLTPIWKRLSFSRKATVRNLTRYKKRFIMTVVGIGGCMGLLLIGFGLKDSITTVAEKQYISILKYDLIAAEKSDASDDEKAELEKVLKGDKDISDFEKVFMKKVTLKSESDKLDVYLIVPSDTDKINDFITLADRKSGRVYDFPENGAYLTEKAGKLLKITDGDFLKLDITGTGNKNIKINNIIENYTEHYIFMSPDYYKDLFGEEVNYNSYLINYINEDIDETALGRCLLNYNACAGLSFTSSTSKSIDDMVTVLNQVIVILILCSGALAFVVLYNLNSINIMERRRELATLKVLGFYDSEVAAYVYRENVILTIFGIIFGVIFGIFLHHFVVSTVETDEMMFGTAVSFGSIIYSIIITAAFAVAVNLVMYFSLKKIDMIESLKSVE